MLTRFRWIHPLFGKKIASEAVPPRESAPLRGSVRAPDDSQREQRASGAQTPHKRRYFTSTVAPASVNFFLMVSASSLETPSFTFFGAPSTRSLASFRPRLVTSRTALLTLILLSPPVGGTTGNS